MNIKNFLPFFKNKEKNSTGSVSYVLMNGSGISSTRYDNPKLALEGYIKNIIVYKVISSTADQFKRLKWRLYKLKSNGEIASEIMNHELLTRLRNPYPQMSKSAFLKRTATQFLIYGNYYIEKIYNPRGGHFNNSKPINLFPLRPDFITRTEGVNSLNSKYSYQPDMGNSIDFYVGVTGKSNLMHGMMFNPDDDFHGLSPLIPAGYSIDTHNEIGKYNFNLLNQGARPSGILTFPPDYTVHDDTIERMRLELDSKYGGSKNVGKNMVLEGGVTWTQVSISSKDGEFLQMKKDSAHEIALAFDFPMDLLNTEQSKYDNLHAAYEQLYDNKIVPMGEAFADDLNNELTPLYGSDLLLKADFSHTKTMQDSKMRLMEKLNPITYISNNEKREMTDYEPMDGEDELQKKFNTPEMNKYIADQVADGLTYSEAEMVARKIYG